MTDEKLLALLKAIDPLAVRAPSGMRAIANAIEAAERERCARLCEQYADDADEWRPIDKARGAAVREVARRIRGS
jgi:hypothetical protein